jgi:hypothetical protein
MTKLKILLVKRQLRILRNNRREALLDISVNQPREAARVAHLEDVRPLYFRDIDLEIASRERLLRHLRRKDNNSPAVVLFF